MRGMPHYANTACISFSKLLTSHSQERITLDPKLHLTITSDNVVTKTSNLDGKGKKTWGIQLYGPLHSSGPLFPQHFNKKSSQLEQVVIEWEL